MKHLVFGLAVLAAAALPASPALADTYFVFSFTGTVDLGGGTTFSGSGVLDTISLGGGEYQVEGIAGTADGSKITGLLPVDTYPSGGGETANDNILIYPPGGVLDNKFFDHAGVSFSLANGDDVNLNDTDAFENAVIGVNDNTELDKVTVGLDPAPEPSSLVLLGTGVLGAAGAIRRRLSA